MRYYLHRYGDVPKAIRTFSSRRSFCAYMRKMNVPVSELADKYFLHVMAPHYSATYDFVPCGSEHLKAVLHMKYEF